MASNDSTQQSINSSVDSEIGKIIDNISNLHKRVSDNIFKKNETPTPLAQIVNKENQLAIFGNLQGKKSSSKSDADKNDNSSNDQQFNEVNPLDQLGHDLTYMRYALNKLQGFEGNFGKSIQELKDDLEIILASKSVQESETQQDEIRRISQKFLNLKSRIPPVHSNSSEDIDAQQRRRTNQSKDLPNMPQKPRFTEDKFYNEFLEKFDGLDNDKSRECLLCFAVFPENAVIKRRLLLHWWIGEGFLDRRTENGNTIPAEKVADDLLQKFEEKGFVLPVDKKHRKVANSFRMNPLVRSAVITRAALPNFFDFDSEGIPTLNFQNSIRTCLVYAHKEGSIPDRLEQLAKEIAVKQIATDIEAKSAKKGDHNNLTPREIDLQKQLANNNVDLDLTPKEIEQKIEKIRAEIGTVFNVSEEFPEFKYDWFSKMKGIKVLYLGRWQSTVKDIPHIEVESTDFLKGLKNMKDHLRILSFQGISGIRQLPKEISYLEKLEILDVRACYSLDELPDNISKLKNLTHLDISECFLLDGIPTKVCKLTKLQVLKGFVITDHAKDDHGWKQQWCSLEDLKNLKQLRKLSININSKEFQAKKLDTVLSFENLLELKVSWGGGSDKPAAEKKKPSALTRVATLFREKLQYTSKDQHPSKLEKIDLQCFPDGNLPDWLIPKNLTKLQCLYIRGGRVNSLPGKQKWKTVEILRVKYLNELKTNWIELRELFPKLVYLEKFKCPNVTLCPCDGTGVWEKSELRNQSKFDEEH